MKSTFFHHLLLLSLPLLSQAQFNTATPYLERWDHCHSIVLEQNKAHPGSLTLARPECMIGALAPMFSVVTLDGKAFTTESLKGKITILNFWMISCPPCIAEIPGLNNVVRKYGRDDINYIAFGIDDEKDINGFLKNHPWSFDQVAAGTTMMLDEFKIVFGFPTTFVIDQQGIIIDAFSGGTTDEQAVKEIEDKLSADIDKVHK